MKVYIQTDLEGIAGFCFFENRKSKEQDNILHRHRMYRLLTDEVNAAVKAAFDSGATEVIVNDSHGSGYNIFFENLDPRCRIICGKNCSGPHWLPLLDESFDAMVLVGMHAMGATPCSITPHSKWDVNDGAIYLSEASMAAAIAGDHGVPTVMISGDDKITAEVSAKIPEIAIAKVKDALSPYQACHMIPSAAQDLIYRQVKAGLANRKNIQPYKIPGPVKLALWDAEGHLPPMKKIGDTVCADSIEEAFFKFLSDKPWCCFNTEVPDGFIFP